MTDNVSLEGIDFSEIMNKKFAKAGAKSGAKMAILKNYQHILKQDVTLDAEPYAAIPAGTPIFGEEQKGFIVFQFGEYKRQIPKSCFETV